MTSWPIKTEIPVLWGDMDSFGHVNNIIYPKWCETSRVEMFCKIWDLNGLSMQQILEGEGIGPILANFNMNFRIPVVFPDIIFVETRIKSIGNTSFGIQHQITSKNNGSKIVFDADSVVVMVNYKTGDKVKIDSENRKKLETFT